MLKIYVPERKLLNEETNELTTVKGTWLQMEHSLVSISKWEANWGRPYLIEKPLTPPQLIDYFKCMTITQNVDPLVYNCLTKANCEDIIQHIRKPMTATTLQKKKTSRKRIITSEVIYAWMFALNIPLACEKWHLNRLLTLIEVCQQEREGPKKQSKKETLEYMESMNERNKAILQTRG